MITITIITVYSHHFLNEIKLDFTLTGWMQGAHHANYINMQTLLMIIFCLSEKKNPPRVDLNHESFG